jgi:hypothetical protein
VAGRIPPLKLACGVVAGKTCLAVVQAACLTPGGRDAEMTKKVWQTPQLVVLVRIRPEEAILLVCKGPTAFAGGKHIRNGSCWINSPCMNACEAMAAS